MASSLVNCWRNSIIELRIAAESNVVSSTILSSTPLASCESASRLTYEERVRRVPKSRPLYTTIQGHYTRSVAFQGSFTRPMAQSSNDPVSSITRGTPEVLKLTVKYPKASLQAPPSQSLSTLRRSWSRSSKNGEVEPFASTRRTASRCSASERITEQQMSSG